MKILIDPIYTQYVHRCASTVKMLRCVEQLLETSDEIMFYWMIPEILTEEEQAWLPTNPRIKYIKVPYFEDRYKEYWHASETWRRLVSFNGPLWDIDMVITNRTTLVPFLKWALHRPGGMLAWSKYVILIEDMPIMSFKMFIPQSTKREGDISSLCGYLEANLTLISAYWEKAHIVRLAKKHLSPTSVKYLQDNIIEATHHQNYTTAIKKREHVEPMLKGERKFTISYAGRMVNRDFVEDSFDIILKSWIAGGDDVRIILCTVSKNFGRVKHEAIKHIEIMNPQREEFWRIMSEESDVGVFMSRDEDLSMSMLEPLMLGTPLVIYRAEHAVATLGPDYPFFVNGVNEGFALIREFKNNYQKMYALFIEWSKNYFQPLLKKRAEDYIPDKIVTAIIEWESRLHSNSMNLPNNEIVQLIANRTTPGVSFFLLDEMKALEKSKEVRGAITGKSDSQFDGLRLTFSTHFDVYRIGLLKMGFIDASPEAGHMVFPKVA